MKKIRFVLLFLLLAFNVNAQDKDVIHYGILVEVNDRSDTIKGYASIEFKHLKEGPVVDFDLVSVKPTGKGMKVESVTSYGDPVTFTHKNDRLSININDLEKGNTSMVEITYKGIPADGLIISKNKYGDRTFFADNWPNRAHHWIPCNDKPSDKASFDITVVSPPHYKIISNGLHSWDPETRDGSLYTMWIESTEQPTKVMVIGAAKFAVKTYEDSPEGIPVTAWVYPQDQEKGFHDFALAPSILKFFIGYIGPYPFKKLANVQSKTRFGGMENSSAIFYSENAVTGDRSSEDLIAHEIAHQWFGNSATERSFTHLWLSEGFATYLTNIYLENKYGKEKMIERLKEDREQVIDFAMKHAHGVVDSTCSYMDLLNANSYQKGGWILHMLRNEVGDNTFQKILQTYYTQYKGGNADTRDFEKVAEKVSGKELTWFFDQWLYRPGIPELKMETKIQDGNWYLYITQKGKPYRFNLDVDVVDEDGGLTRNRFEVNQKESSFKVPVKGSRVQFSLDPEVKLLYKLVD